MQQRKKACKVQSRVVSKIAAVNELLLYNGEVLCSINIVKQVATVMAATGRISAKPRLFNRISQVALIWTLSNTRSAGPTRLPLFTGSRLVQRFLQGALNVHQCH